MKHLYSMFSGIHCFDDIFELLLSQHIGAILTVFCFSFNCDTFFYVVLFSLFYMYFFYQLYILYYYDRIYLYSLESGIYYIYICQSCCTFVILKLFLIQVVMFPYKTMRRHTLESSCPCSRMQVHILLTLYHHTSYPSHP